MPSGNSNNKLRQTLDRAIRLHNAGKSSAAIRLLKPCSKSAAAIGYLAGIYFQQDDMHNAAKYFHQATLLNPHSELASVGLFHSLWSQGRGTEATEEMQRFLRIADSPEYTRLLHDLAVEGQLVPHLEPAIS